MVKRITLLALLFVPFFLSAQEKINWLTWQEAVEKQKTTRKKILVDLYTDWCGWCKRMDATTFQNPEIVKCINKYYYPVKFNAEQRIPFKFNGREFVNVNPDGKRGTHTFAMSLLDNQMSYPSFVILDENYTRVNIIKGYKNVDPMLGMLLFYASNEYINYKKYLDYERSKAQTQQVNKQ